MSQDLFAAFGVPESHKNQAGDAAPSASNQNLSFFGDLPSEPTTPVPPQPANNLNDDDWGEFEGAVDDKPTPIESSVIQNPKLTYAAGRYHYNLEDLGTHPVQQPSKGSDLNFDLLSLGTESQVSSIPTRANNGNKNKPNDPAVLFDASDDDGAAIDDFDDFGEFEDFEPPKTVISNSTTPSQPITNIDLLGLDDDISQPLQKQNTPLEHTAFAFGQTTTGTQIQQPIVNQIVSKKVSVVKHATEDPVEDEKWDEWGEDDDEKPSPFTKSSSNARPESKPSENVNLMGFANVNATNIEQPPTTIPPPAVVLSIFPSIFEVIEKELLVPLSNHSQDLRRAVLSDSQTVAYLHGYLAVIVVLGHVIAGRKSRWKRDTILAQSMRIGPASTGRLSGMKVTSIDKSESNREDREAAEVLRAWNLQVGRLRSLVIEARKLTDLYLPNIPELRETMPVKNASEAEGGVSSTKACALCGLKRNERVGKVDFEVEDSFGEWWDEKVIMHRACRNFWSKHEASLRQR